VWYPIAMVALAAIDCDWDPGRRLFRSSRGAVVLSPREATVLGTLVRAGGDVVARDDFGLDGRTVDFTIRRLRTKVELDPGDPRIVLTVHGLGYRLGLARQRPEAPRMPRAGIPLGDLQLDLDLGLVHHLGRELALTTLQAGVLRCLVAAEGRAVSRAELLRAVWGRTGRDPRAVDATVCKLRAVLEPDPVNPTWLRTVPGTGYRLVLEQPKTNLQPRPGAVGRAVELAQLLAWCDSPGWVLVSGPPGIGKTHLAERACQALAEQKPGGAWWVDCAPLRSGQELLAALSGVLGLANPSGEARVIAAALARRPPLALVFDNLEQLADAEEVLGPLCRGPHVLVGTSSRRLELAGRALVLGGLSAEDGRALYERGASSPSSPAAVDALVRALDGNALAITLAARRSEALPADTMLSDPSLVDHLEDGSNAGRHRSVAATIEWASRLCTAEQRDVLAGLGVFRAPFGLDAVRAVLGRDAERHVVALVDRSLVARASSGAVASWRLPPLVNSWVCARWPVRPEVARRWARWFVARVDALRDGPEGVARAELDSCLPDVVAAAEHQLADHPDDSARVVRLLFECKWLPRATWQPLWERLVAHPAPFPTRAELCLLAVQPRLNQGDVEGAEALVRAAVGAGADDDAWCLRSARTRIQLHRHGISAADPGAAEPAGHFRDRVEWAWLRGRFLGTTGAADDGLALLLRAISLARKVGYASAVPVLQGAYAQALTLVGGDADEAGEILERCATALEAQGMQAEAATAWWRAATLRAIAGRGSRAAALADRAGQWAADHGDEGMALRVRSVHLRLALDDDPQRCLGAATDVLARARARADHLCLAVGLFAKALSHARLGERGPALATVDAGLAERPEPAIRAGLQAIGAHLDPGRPVPADVGSPWADALLALVRRQRDGTPLGRRAEELLPRNAVVRAFSGLTPR
jgi:DNA-binding response OmpR family regulator